jgi:queuosine precursor transporter
MIALIGYVLSIVLANALISWVGVVPVGFGLYAPAGVFAAGLAFTFRDALQEDMGRRWAVLAIVAGALLSALLSPALALASGAAFLLSEVADMAIYTPLRRRSWALAATLSNVVGAVVDSALFLWLAFGSLEFLPGQVFGKLVATVVAVTLWGAFRARRGQKILTV